MLAISSLLIPDQGRVLSVFILTWYSQPVSFPCVPHSGYVSIWQHNLCLGRRWLNSVSSCSSLFLRSYHLHNCPQLFPASQVLSRTQTLTSDSNSVITRQITGLLVKEACIQQKQWIFSFLLLKMVHDIPSSNKNIFFYHWAFTI